MAKKIKKDTSYTYTFSTAGNVHCTVDGGSVKIWINGSETEANSYTATGLAGANQFPSTQPQNLASRTNPKWVLHLKGVNDNNTVSVTVPALGTWDPIPTEI